MSKVITFSRIFPSYHPRAGEPTYFVEKILKGIGHVNYDEDRLFNPRLSLDDFYPKHHTIRAGHRWKAGDVFSPRVWSGKPYHSKQIQFAPDILIEKVFPFEVDACGVFVINGFYGDDSSYETIAKNDGLSEIDLISWFDKPFKGQIICWNKDINY